MIRAYEFGYRNLHNLLGSIEEPNGSIARKLYEDYHDLFCEAKGSSTKHQAWEGGYVHHITEIMNIACVMHHALNSCRHLPFSVSDALLTLYLHDVEKPWVYAKDPDKRIKFKDDSERHEFNHQLINRYGFKLTSDHWNAIKYVHGEGDDYDPKVRIQTPLAAFIHHCDNTSARIWFNHPVEGHDPWSPDRHSGKWFNK